MVISKNLTTSAFSLNETLDPKDQMYIDKKDTCLPGCMVGISLITIKYIKITYHIYWYGA